MAKARKPPIYPGQIDCVEIKIPNAPPDQFRQKLNSLPFLGYHVETLADGRKICITKPGGKAPFGNMKVHDFMVWIYDESKSQRWRISHKEIYEDIESKIKADLRNASEFIDVLHRVCRGEEPTDILTAEYVQKFSRLPGLSAELILKTYKWIWGQEDCNYPSGEGRWMSMNPILRLRQQPEQAQ